MRERRKLLLLLGMIKGGASYIWKTITGSPPLEFTDAKGGLISKLIQKGKVSVSGGEIICNNGVLRKSKNLFDPAIFEENGGVLQTDGSYYLSSISQLLNKVAWNADGYEGQIAVTLIRKCDINRQSLRLYIKYTDGTRTLVGSSFATGDFDTYTVVSDASKTVSTIIFDYGSNLPTYAKIQVEKGSAATSYESYDSIVVDGTPEVLSISPSGDTATVEDLYAVGDIRDEQDIITGRVIARTAPKIYHDGDDVPDRYIGELVDGNPIVYALEDKYEGDVVTFEASEAVPMRNVKVHLEPIQDLHGYDSPWPAGGGKNKFDPSAVIFKKWRLNSNILVTVQDSSSVVSVSVDGEDITISNTIVYYGVGFEVEAADADRVFSVPASIGGAVQFWSAYEDGATRISTGSTSCAIPANTSGFIAFRHDVTGSVTTKAQLESGSTASAWASYENLCPISGRDSVEVYDDPVYGGEIEWNQHAQDGNFGDANKWRSYMASVTTTQVSDNVLTQTLLNAGGVGYQQGFASQWNYKPNLNHKYFLGISAKYSYASRVSFEIGGAEPKGYATANWTAITVGSWTRCEYIFSPLQDNSTYILIKPKSGTCQAGDTMQYRDLILVDLTQMFGAGNEPSTVEEFKALFPKDYYPYNAGEKTCVSAVNGDPYRHETIQLPQTIYGGDVEVVSGSGERKMAIVDLGTLTWSKSGSRPDHFYASTKANVLPYTHNDSCDMICSNYKYDGVGNSDVGGYYGPNGTFRYYYASSAPTSIVREIYISDEAKASLTAEEFKAAMSGVMLCYELATPTPISTTPTEISTVEGQNNVFSPDGGVTVVLPREIEYYVDPQPLSLAKGNNELSVTAEVDDIPFEATYKAKNNE